MSKTSSFKSSNARPRAILLADRDRPEIRERADDLRPTIDAHLDVVAEIDDISGEEFPEVEAEFGIVLGGDGSMLRTAHMMGYRQLPVIGVNLGHLGFLAGIQPEDLAEVLPCLACGEYEIVSHLILECVVLRGGKELCRTLALNEAAVMAGPPFAMLAVQLYVDGELATTYSCDGLIVSTPVGSTAHNLSAGGPILRKALQAVVVSPISPHTLTNRPVVDSADRVYELAVPNPNEGTTLVVDGKVVCQITADDRIRVERSKAEFQLIEISGRGYYRTLREKLGWGGRLKLK
ncbi:NAD(+)/NADH kinase [Adhaeretor mobilis]|nr:NAD(+)/NADH kinase [Adhaeretor mobilis]